ncbi:cell division ATP-binding protein FtsE [Lichenicoccus roseus]|uniref:ATP-binding cassette domain-containing protein n=1 Tax=Lichenicoccus roseus TaxID=2683649 RepID=A0A5R9JCX2_9PROT|nr:ATP-binding cassette domain-containing protein [Lichenicoccus roseus]TLU73461.1 ATP-binding cassette domain-containing protein [Lichenicoccus roseus]
MIRLSDVSLRIGNGPNWPGRTRFLGRAAQRREVLQGVSFTVPAGAFRWLLGASGAGKSSLLRVLQLGAMPTTGEFELFGTSVQRAPRRQLVRLRRRMGVVFQDLRLLPELSVFDNVALPMRLAQIAEPRVQAEVSEMLNWIGLGRRLLARPGELSGGEQQRAAIARAVVLRPPLLLADEPTGSLDAPQALRLMELLMELNQLGSTVIVATHNDHLVRHFQAPSLRLDRGRLVEDGARAVLVP